MSHLNPDGSSIYDHLDETDPISIVIDMDALAEKVEDSNYGTVRFLAALRRVRLRRLAERIEKYRRDDQHDIARRVAADGDAIVRAIETLMWAGEF
jgi:hypothetical protein